MRAILSLKTPSADAVFEQVEKEKSFGFFSLVVEAEKFRCVGFSQYRGDAKLFALVPRSCHVRSHVACVSEHSKNQKNQRHRLH